MRTEKLLTGISAVGLCKRFGDTAVLRGVDLEVGPGAMLALLGPNGAGKTTTIRILTTLLRPDAGSATIGGHDLLEAPDRVRSVIGLTGQETTVDGVLTGRENLVMMGRLNNLDSRHTRARAGELLEQFELSEAADRPVKTYSGGMRRRLDLAVSVVTDPPVLFLDEPTTGLDPRARLQMWDAIRGFMDRGSAVLLTTQYLEEADRLADRIALIDDGRIIAEGAAADLKRQVGSQRATFTFAPDGFAKAAELIGDDGGMASHHGTTIQVAVADAWHLRAILERLHGAEIEPIRLKVDEPSLDDVFLQLTGHKPNEVAA